MTLWRRLLLLALTAGLVGALVVTGLREVIPQSPPPEVKAVEPEHPPLTEHLALLVVDGLRYDIATDPQVMPGFARRMKSHASGTIWAGPITMTSGASQAFFTGVYGDLDSIVFNETLRPTPFDNLLTHADRRGLFLAATGDRSYFVYFGDVWDLSHPDPPGVSIEDDYNDEIFAAAHEFAAHRPRPNLLVAHWVTPDHQGHVHGIFSDGYRAHMRGFDRLLEELLAALPADTTVIVTSDHGVVESGTHGSDMEIARRCPIYAYGPGIRAGHHPDEIIEQADLAATFARLLGLPTPANSVGHVLARWLDLPPAEQAAIACAELDRAERYGSAVLGQQRCRALRQGACEQGDAERKLSESHRASRRIAAAIKAQSSVESKSRWLLLAATALGALLLALLWYGPGWSRLRGWAPALLVAMLVLAVALVIIRGNEKLPGHWPDYVRIPMMVAVNTALLLATIWVKPFARWVDRHAPLVATAAVGGLVASYTAYTQPQSYIFAALTVLMLLVPWLRHHLGPAGEQASYISWYRALLAIALTATLWPMGFLKHSLLPSALLQQPLLTRYLAMLLIVLFTAERLARRRHELSSWGRRALLLGCLALALWTPWAHWSQPVGRAMALWVLPPIAGTYLWRSGRRTAGELLWLASYAMIARDTELFFLLPTIVIAESVGEVMGAMARVSGDRVRHAAVAGIVTFIFALTYAQRIGIETGLDFIHFDWTAGTFGDTNVSLWRIGTAIVTKHSLARAALVLTVLMALPAHYCRAVARGLLLVELGRVVALTFMLVICRYSFWTSLRVLGDLPHAFIAVMVATVACVIVLRPQRRERLAGDSLSLAASANAAR